MRLDEEKLEALRSWGERLRQARSEESAAVGRAILMLVEEIDRLHIDLWHARIATAEREPALSDESAEEEPQAALHSRLRRVLSRKPESAPVEAVEQSQPDDTVRAQAWIASLRRQK